MVAEETRKKEKKIEGLKMMRADRYARTPEYVCENCKCKRYSPCGCTKSTKKKEKNKVVAEV